MAESEDKKSHSAMIFCGCDVGGVVSAEVRNDDTKLVLFSRFAPIHKVMSGKGSDWDINPERTHVILHTRAGDRHIPLSHP